MVIQKLRMKIALVAILLFALPVRASPTSIERAAHSSPADLRRFVAVAQDLERAPFGPSAEADRAWALEWLTDAPDVSVDVCLEPLGGGPEKGYPHGPEVVVQYMLSMAAFLIQHPEKVNDPEAQQLAGVEGALTSYKSILASEPKAKSATLEKMGKVQAQGQLPGFVRKAYLRCKRGGFSPFPDK